MTTGATTVVFPSTGSVYETVDITGQSGLSASSDIEAFKMAEASVDNTKDAHVFAPMRLTCEYLSSTSFRIHVFSDISLRGTYNIRWVSKA